MYVAYVFIYQSIFVVYILAYKFDILQIFKSTVYRTRIVDLVVCRLVAWWHPRMLQ